MSREHSRSATFDVPRCSPSIPAALVISSSHEPSWATCAKPRWARRLQGRQLRWRPQGSWRRRGRRRARNLCPDRSDHITISPGGAILVKGGDRGDAGGPGQAFFGAATIAWTTSVGGNGYGGVGVAGGGAGGSGGDSSQVGNAGSRRRRAAYIIAACRQVRGGPATRLPAPTASGTTPVGHLPAGRPMGMAAAARAAAATTATTRRAPEAAARAAQSTVYLVAAVLRIEGTVSATGGLGGLDDYTYTGQANRECCNNGGPGSVGRIRLDYTSATLSGTVTPAAGYISAPP
eukprot:scaffold52192_cov67-Phaeocystis_antarctica.AAC.1